MSEASKYSSGWVIMTVVELAPLRELKWELWQCLNAMASGLQVFLGQEVRGSVEPYGEKGRSDFGMETLQQPATLPLLQRATDTHKHTSYFRSCQLLNCWHTWRTLSLQRSLWPFKVGRSGERLRGLQPRCWVRSRWSQVTLCRSLKESGIGLGTAHWLWYWPAAVFYTEDRSAAPNSLHPLLLGHHLTSTLVLGIFDDTFPFGKREMKGREDSLGWACPGGSRTWGLRVEFKICKCLKLGHQAIKTKTNCAWIQGTTFASRVCCVSTKGTFFWYQNIWS